jgi:hypothetical protein
MAAPTRLAVLWELEMQENRLACVVYRRTQGLELRLESPQATIMAEPFEMQPRMLAKARALRNSLKRRGWRDGPRGGAQAPRG